MENSKKRIRVANFSVESYRKKIHIRLDDDLHQKLRMKVAQDGTTIQNYIIGLLENSLKDG